VDAGLSEVFADASRSFDNHKLGRRAGCFADLSREECELIVAPGKQFASAAQWITRHRKHADHPPAEAQLTAHYR
jgi:hypothetical protein